MGNFLKENWAYIVIPIVLVAIAVIALLVMGGGDDPAAGFQYNL